MIIKKLLLSQALLGLCFSLSCVTTPVSPSKYFAKPGKVNAFTALWLPFASERAHTAYSHTLRGFSRTRSDCAPNCPKVDVWKYVYRPNGQDIVDTKPISTRKEYWKANDEARIMAISMFNDKKLYADALFEYLKSFNHLKKVNKIEDPLWGFETFTVRVYVAKRNPSRVAELGPLSDDTSAAMIERFLEAGCEVAYVDNGLAKTGKDGTFWRFMVAAEEMPKGQRIRYLVRDADAILSGGEAFTVGEWIASGLEYHRMSLIPVCFGPLTIFTWGGSHTGAGPFADMKTMIEYFPYRLKYGDDELFTRDMVWPRIKAIGSVMTHHYPRETVFAIANPYRGSCEEPTQAFCDEMRPGGNCPDVLMPEEIKTPWKSIGLRGSLAELAKDPEIFDLHAETKRGKAAITALASGF